MDSRTKTEGILLGSKTYLKVYFKKLFYVNVNCKYGILHCQLQFYGIFCCLTASDIHPFLNF